MNLNNLLKPKKIAIIGASEKEGSFGGATCSNILDFSNPDKYYFVNPNRDQVFNKKCYSSIDDIGEKIDQLVICTPAHTIPDILKQGARNGVNSAVIYASGYGEAGTEEGKVLENELVELSKELNISILGPNCGGFINYIDDVYNFAFIAEKRDRRGAIGLVSQSGQLCLSLMDNIKGNFSYVISAGNATTIKVEDYINFLVDDKDTKVVSVYLEGVERPWVLEEALKKAAIKKKPVVILKTGRSEKGSQISESHTGSLSGSDKVYDAIFNKYGVIRADDMEELLSISHLLSTLDYLPKRAQFAAMSVSGGETIITADVGEMMGIKFAEFSKKTLDGLRELLPEYANPNNPLDMTATLSYDSEKFAKALRAIMDDEEVDMVLIGYTLLYEVVDPCIYYLVEGIEKVVSEGNSKPIAMVPFIENTRNPECMKKLENLGVSILPPVSYAMNILKKISNFIGYDHSARTLDLAIPENKIKDLERVFLSEHESKNILKENGIKTPKEYLVSNVEEAIEKANKIGYPVVMKIESRDIPHKSDIGGVKININSDLEVEENFKSIMRNAREKEPNAKINGVLVQEMLEGGLEIIVGINNDLNYGPMILCGLGGVFVEIFKDTALYPVPLNKKEAMGMIKSLKAYPLMDGYRNTAKLDVDSLADLIVKISDLANKNKNEILELDINPVFLYEEGYAVADSLIVKGE